MTSPSPFTLMQAAVDIVNDSPHPSNKVAATLAGLHAEGRPWTISRTNCWPPLIESRLGREARIGDSSGTVHAEVACILAALEEGLPTEGATLCVTDPFCPNCAKNIAEAGIKSVYIDHKGFAKDFAERRGGHFRDMSLEICEKAGLSVYEINRKAEDIRPISEPLRDYAPSQDNPPEILDLPAQGYAGLLALKTAEAATQNFALAGVTDSQGKDRALYVLPQLALGYTRADPPDFHESHDSKYNFIIGPMNRLLMQTARRGWRIDRESLCTARVPTARELVNLVAAGISRIAIADPESSRDESGLQAMHTLRQAGILRSEALPGEPLASS